MARGVLWLAGLVGAAALLGGLGLQGKSTMDATTSDVTLTPQDEEAAARMVASENPGANAEVWAEQVWTQLRARKRGQSLYERITGGHGFGPQNGSRPVSTEREPKEIHRLVVREVLTGRRPSRFPEARTYFEPAAQDAVFRQVEKARADKAAGRPVSERSQRLLDQGYQLDAAGVRQKWSAKGRRLAGVLGPVEFWT